MYCQPTNLYQLTTHSNSPTQPPTSPTPQSTFILAFSVSLSCYASHGFFIFRAVDSFSMNTMLNRSYWIWKRDINEPLSLSCTYIYTPFFYLAQDQRGGFAVTWAPRIAHNAIRREREEMMRKKKKIKNYLSRPYIEYIYIYTFVLARYIVCGYKRIFF